MTPGFATAPAWRAWLAESRCELLRVLRTPGFAVPTVLLPMLLFGVFGVGMAKGPDAMLAMRYLLVSYGSFGMISASLLGIGVSVAIEREHGLLQLKRAMPLPAGAYFGAKVLGAMAITALCSLALMIIAACGGLRLETWQWPALLLVNMLGCLPFCAIGLWIGARVSASSAPGMINLLNLPMAFLSGLWMPLSMLPAMLRGIAPIWPAYHFAQVPLALFNVGDGSSLLIHVVVLAGITVFFAASGLRRLLGRPRRTGRDSRKIQHAALTALVVALLVAIAQPRPIAAVPVVHGPAPATQPASLRLAPKQVLAQYGAVELWSIRHV